MIEFTIKGHVKDVTNSEIKSKKGDKFSKSEIRIAYPAKRIGWKGVQEVVEKEVILTHFMSWFKKELDPLEDILFEISMDFKRYQFYEVEAGFYIDSKVSEAGYTNANLNLNWIKVTGSGDLNDIPDDIKANEDFYEDLNGDKQLPF
jgi:hypothetical protein